MGDLISRKALIDEIKNGRDKPIIYDGMQEVAWINQCIENAPTAFDLESVIAELWELKTYKLGMADAMSELMKRDKLGTYVCLEDVIEILKSAANATNGKIGG